MIVLVYIQQRFKIICICLSVFIQLFFMHPKRFRERIDKAQMFLSPATHYEPFTSARNRQTQSNPPVNNDLIKAMIEMTNKLDISLKTKNSKQYIQQMEIRDRYIEIPPVKLPETQPQREKTLKLWLGEVSQKVFSISFNYFSHKQMDTQTMKIFCSECLMGNIIALSKMNKLTEKDLQLVNLHLKKQILPYFLLRYPQSTNKQINQKFNKVVSVTDYLETNQNNMFLKSKIRMEYRADGIYYDLIMKFINYIQALPEKRLPGQNNRTMYQDFIQKIQKLFTSVYNRQWTQTNLYDTFTAQNMNISTLRTHVQALQSTIQQNLIKQLLQQQQTTKITNNKLYQEKVKQYTKYIINRKISENVPLYSYQNIRHSNIKILDPAVRRIIVKWCSELEEKFQSQFFLEKKEPFVMINGDQVEMNDDFRQKLSQYATQQWQNIQQFLTEILTNIYQKQSQLSFSNMMYYSDYKYPQFQQSLIKFANRNTQDVNHYAVCYLNRLIHGLMKISKKVYELHLKGWAEWPYPPFFVSFRMADLLRCKCFSKEKEIIRIYKQLEIQSQINPQILRVVKVKNRLNKGTKDILLNILFHQQILCQIQLAIKLDLSQLSLWSDIFNHYIYQLQRSAYGPISQLCSIWSSNDERASLLSNQKMRVEEFDHRCEQGYVQEIFPFTCRVCYRHYSEKRYIVQHSRCRCGKFWICALCRINGFSEKELVQQLNAKAGELKIGKRIPVNQEFPEYFVGFKLESLEVIGQKFRKFVIDHQSYLTWMEGTNLRVRQLKKSDKKLKQQLYNDFIFFQLPQPDPQLSPISPQQALNQTVVTQISECYKKKSQSLRIPRKHITTQLLLKQKDHRAQLNITSLSFPQNCITSLQQLGSAFPNVTMLNLNKNQIENLEGIGKFKALRDLYIGENLFRQVVELDLLVGLKYVQLGDNANAPEICCDLSGLVMLESLTLIRSNLKTFPQKVCRIPNLKLLWLFQNKICQIPTQIQNLQHLQYLHLQMNNIQNLPKQLFYLPQLIKLMLAYNRLKCISAEIQNLGKLEILTLEGNPLEGIPIVEILKLRSIQLASFDKECQPLFIGFQLITGVMFK